MIQVPADPLPDPDVVATVCAVVRLLLYMRGQRPAPVGPGADGEPEIQALEAALGAARGVREFAVAFGGTVVQPKEVYLLRFAPAGPTMDARPGAGGRVARNLQRALVADPPALFERRLGPTKMYVLLHAAGLPRAPDGFAVKRGFRLRAKALCEIAVGPVGDPELGAPEPTEEPLWFQATSVVSGRKG